MRRVDLEAARATVEAIAEHRNPISDVVFVVATKLGDAPFLFAFLTLGYWLGPRRTFARAAAMLLTAALLNAFIKGAVQSPRPMVEPMIDAQSWSFPSGHAQMAAVLWLHLAWVGRRARARSIGLVVLSLLIAASRPYLGVHYVHDVVVGYGLGVAQVALVIGYERVAGGRLHVAPGLWVPAASVVSAFVVPFLFDPSVRAGSALLAGTLIGLVAGEQLERRTIRSGAPRTAARAAAMVALGLVGLAALWAVLRAAEQVTGTSMANAARMVAFAAAGFWVGFGVPRIAFALGWSTAAESVPPG